MICKPGEHTQSGRLIRFTNVQEIVEREAILKVYIVEAIDVEKSGLKGDYKQSTKLVLPEELLKTFAESPAFKTAFDAVTPGPQRAYVLYLSAAKQSKCRSRGLNNTSREFSMERVQRSHLWTLPKTARLRRFAQVYSMRR